MSSPLNTIADWSLQRECVADDVSKFALIALGANLAAGERTPSQTLICAIDRLSALSPRPLVVSPVYETEPDDCPPGTPVFLNAVVALYPPNGCTPENLLEALLALEQELGRVRSGLKNEARALDLDLLAFGREQRDNKFIVIPHPRAARREFVLTPLVSIWPDYQFVGQSLTVDQLLKLCRRSA
jgi:2-amino-4-hydroxy-6-hydroxymethyldihydropteridine diphosphokinase